MGGFCDWGIELSKADKSSIDELGSIFKESMKLLHPFMPFISENLYQKLSNSTLEESQSIMVKRYPKLRDIDNSIEDEFNLIMEAIVSIRRCKVLVDKANQRVDKVYIKLSKGLDKSLAKPFIEKLAKVDEVIFIDEKLENSVTDVSDNLESFISTSSIDLDAIKKKLSKQKEKLEKEINKLNGMLNNKRFLEMPQRLW